MHEGNDFENLWQDVAKRRAELAKKATKVEEVGSRALSHALAHSLTHTHGARSSPIRRRKSRRWGLSYSLLSLSLSLSLSRARSLSLSFSLTHTLMFTYITSLLVRHTGKKCGSIVLVDHCSHLVWYHEQAPHNGRFHQGVDYCHSLLLYT